MIILRGFRGSQILWFLLLRGIVRRINGRKKLKRTGQNGTRSVMMKMQTRRRRKSFHGGKVLKKPI